jgi:hypothetical protein
MKKIALFILFAFYVTFGFAQCPPEGNASSKRLQALNDLKNRQVDRLPKPIPISIDNILADGVDSNRFNDTMYCVTEAWVVYWKLGGPESCNCQSDDKDSWDIHIGISGDSAANKKDCMIIEITPASKKKMGLIGNSFGNQIIHHKIRVYGFMFWDDEHKQNSTNTAKPGTRNIFRKTAWELHPCTEIEILQ